VRDLTARERRHMLRKRASVQCFDSELLGRCCARVRVELSLVAAHEQETAAVEHRVAAQLAQQLTAAACEPGALAIVLERLVDRRVDARGVTRQARLALQEQHTPVRREQGSGGETRDAAAHNDHIEHQLTTGCRP
jgi:hypothetical protein